jgi:hypothetical protein
MTPLTTIRMMLVSDNLAGVLEILILQDKHNIRTLSLNIKINLHSLRNRLQKLAKYSFFYLFLKLLQINYIFSDNVHI